MAVATAISCPACGFALLPSKFKQGDYYCAGYKNGCKFKVLAGVKTVATLTRIEPLATPSAEQQFIFEQEQQSNNHSFVNALAGTGKTTVLTQLVRIYSERSLSVCCLAFARRDKQALEARTAGKAFVKTSNGAGLAILAAVAKQRKQRVKLIDSLAWNVLDNWEQSEGRKPEATATKAVAIALCEKVRSILPLVTPQKPTHNDYVDIADRFNLDIDDENKEMTFRYADYLFSKLSDLAFAFTVGIDFAGQMFLPVYHGFKSAQRFARVLIDEGQDQCWINRQIALLYLADNGRIVVIGDNHQAIYGWRGADENALGEWSKLLPGAAEYPLTVCRRCSDSVIADAQRLVPAIKGTGKHSGSSSFLPTAKLLPELLKKRKGLVLCRANAPLISLCLELLRNSIPALLVRNDVTRTLESLLNKISGSDDSYNIDKLLPALSKHVAEQTDKLSKRKNAEAKIQALQDRADTIAAFADADGVNTVGDIKRKLHQLFADISDDESMGEKADKAVILSTVHGAKGGEAKTVYLFSPDGKKGSLWDAVWSNERDRDNVLYVAITRAEIDIVYAGAPPTLKRFSPME